MNPLLFQTPVWAQIDDSTTQDFFAESPLILTASRLTKPLLESPASVSVIERDLIVASGVREIAELFRLVPGFVVGYHSGHSPAVAYHGLGQEFGRQIQVLVDGRSVFIPSFGGVPWSNIPLLIEDIERIEEADNTYLNLEWEGVWESSSSLARLTHTQQEVVDNYNPGPLTLGGIPGITTFIDFDRISERTDLEFVQTNDIGNNKRLVYGGSLRKDRVKSLFLLNSNRFHEIDTQRIFGSLEWRFDDDWLLDLGVMVEDSDLTDNERSPRISLIRRLGKNHALRLVASAAKRNPILWESDGETEFVAQVPGFGQIIIPRWIRNNELEPESIESFEIGLRSQHSADFGSDVKLFGYRISDQIDNDIEIEVNIGIPPLDPVRVGTSANIGTTDVKDIELEMQYTPGPKMAINAGFSVIKPDSSNSNFEASQPDYTAFVNLQYRLNRAHEVSAAYYYLDEVTWLDSSEDIPLARRLDLRYAYRLGDRIDLEVIGQNLLEDFVDYEEENLHDQVVYLNLSGGF